MLKLGTMPSLTFLQHSISLGPWLRPRADGGACGPFSFIFSHPASPVAPAAPCRGLDYNEKKGGA